MNTTLQKIKQDAQEKISLDELGMLDILTRNSIFNLLTTVKNQHFFHCIHQKIMNIYGMKHGRRIKVGVIYFMRY